MIRKLITLLTKRDKQLLLSLIIFSVIISIIETAGISVIMPFISVATDFNLIHQNEYYLKFYNYFNFTNDVSFVISFGVMLIIFYIFRSVINLIYYYLLNRFTQGRYHLLAFKLFENYMGLTYKDFIKRNSSTLTKTIISEAFNLTHLISAILFMMSEIFVTIFIYIMMFYINYKITLVLTIFLVLNGFLMLKTVSKTIKKAGVIRAELQKTFYEIINKTFGNFKLIKLSNCDAQILNEFSKSSFGFAKANITSDTLGQVPRLFLEAVGFGMIVSIITYLVFIYQDNVSSILSVISMFVLALYRLMPSVNRIMTSYNHIMFNYKSLDIIYADFVYDIEKLGQSKIEFKNKIVLSNVGFEYKTGYPILNNINLTINKGESIAFIGESGSGKSTLVDMIIGLYKQKYGVITIDEQVLNDSNVKAWRSKIGYIPQSVYLFDGTVADNVAFGSEIDESKIIKVLKQANIYEFLMTKDGIYSKVGEGGVMLSGGQKQRIAIARALYKNPDILILDEATSALDSDTEEKIMNEIYNVSNDKTLIIIAHRLSTITQCKKIYKIEMGKIIKVN